MGGEFFVMLDVFGMNSFGSTTCTGPLQPSSYSAQKSHTYNITMLPQPFPTGPIVQRPDE